jgi:hypothetical protein
MQNVSPLHGNHKSRALVRDIPDTQSYFYMPDAIISWLDTSQKHAGSLIFKKSKEASGYRLP